MRKALPLLLLLIVLPQTNTAYEPHDPIQIDGMHAAAEEPYIIEGYEISNPGGTRIKVMKSENVIIRDNYLHDCGEDGIAVTSQIYGPSFTAPDTFGQGLQDDWSGKGGDYMHFSEGELGASEAALQHGAPYEDSHDNREDGNFWVDITGQLRMR